MNEAEENNIIETVDEEGVKFRFQLFDIVEFEEKEYALLLPVEEEDDDEDDDTEIVLMRLTKEGDEYTFETIDDEEEFERISEYIETLEYDEEE
ncbi:MAG: DUF1292 domain-containing protein [Candidatus Gastranaerophilales bacterium]|nr:DUF1292 domain-containing protein [Candidatus Gastranaerophilales bacterium]